MIDDLKFLIDEADRTNNKTAKEIFLKIASLKEEHQAQALELVKSIVGYKA